MSDFTLHISKHGSLGGMLGDCFELIAHAAAGQVPAGLDEYAEDVERWRQGTREECVRAAADAAEIMAYNCIQLCAHGKASEEVLGNEWCAGRKFFEYMAGVEDHKARIYDDFDARKLACEVELGILDEMGE